MKYQLALRSTIITTLMLVIDGDGDGFLFKLANTSLKLIQ